MAIAVPDKIKVLWFLPTHGDSRYLGTAEGGRAVNLPYLRQIAQAADSLGYYGVLLPTGRSCEDSWVVAAALASQTEKLRFLVAVRPGLQSPTLAARMTATLDRLSGGRLLINVVTGGDPVENAGDGIHLSHAERYEVTQEFLTVYKALLAGETVDFHGKHLKIDGGKLLRSQTATIHEQAAASTIPVEVLQRAFQNVYDTMDAIDTFKLKALDSMKTTINTLGSEVERSKGYIARAEGASQNASGQGETFKLEAM